MVARLTRFPKSATAPPSSPNHAAQASSSPGVAARCGSFLKANTYLDMSCSSLLSTGTPSVPLLISTDGGARNRHPCRSSLASDVAGDLHDQSQLAELRNRSLKDTLIVCCDGPGGLPDVPYPAATSHGW